MLRADEVVARMKSDGLVPVCSVGDLEIAKELARLVASSGLSCLEFTNRGPGALDLVVELLSWGRLELPEVAIGVGTVTDAPTAARVIGAGASFVFAPSLGVDVSRTCARQGVLYVPGCATLTEIQTAYDLGCHMVKLFPAEALGGPAFLAAVRAPCPWVEAIPTGGVEPTVESLAAWYQAGAPAVGMGSKLFSPRHIAKRDWLAVGDALTAAVQSVSVARNGDAA